MDGISRLGLFTATICFLNSCGYSNQATDPSLDLAKDGARLFEGGKSPRQISETASFTFVNASGEPLVNGRVLLGNRLDSPIAENYKRTSGNGEVSFAAWQGTQPITFALEGYIRATYFVQADQPRTLVVNAIPSNAGPVLSGEMQGFGKLEKDGFGDLGLAYLAQPREKMSVLQLSDLVSPLLDQITVVGNTFSVPSNIAFPPQKESYIFFSIELNKPNYRLRVPFASTWKIVASHLRFPFSATVDDLRAGKSIVELIERFELRQASLQNISIDAPNEQSDLNVAQFQFVKSLPYVAPRFDTNRYKLVAISVAESEGLFFLADAKRLEPGQKLKLGAPTIGMGRDGMIVSVFKKADAGSVSSGPESDQVSTAVAMANQSAAIEYLEIPAPPKLKGAVLSATPPKPTSQTQPTLTYWVYSRVDSVQRDNVKFDRKTPEWEIYAADWQSNVELPVLPNEQDAFMPAANHRWEVSFGAQARGGTRLPPEPMTLGKLTHVAKTAADF